MDIIIRTIVKWLSPFIILIGLSVIIHGHLTPGGSFPGGAIIASAFGLAVIAFGIKKVDRSFIEYVAHIIEGLAAAILGLIITYEAMIRRYIHLTTSIFEVLSSPEVLLLNFFGGLMVIGALTLIILLILEE
ncbi:MAG: MnhB domain-containing protein [Candidatus Aenigmatarchaeota archaeon]